MLAAASAAAVATVAIRCMQHNVSEVMHDATTCTLLSFVRYHLVSDE